jgi:dihydrolipoamide dehydrogenase
MSIELRVPDIGDFAEVEVIELLVKTGDTISKDQSLITVESDKASMEIPASHAGVITALSVKIGDKVKMGSLLGTVASATTTTTTTTAPVAAEKPATPAPAPAVANIAPAAAPAAASFAGNTDIQCDVLVLGAGPGGYSAAFRAADLGLNVVMVERYSTLGGVCLNVGCIPSKALLHVAAVMDEIKHFTEVGISFQGMTVDMAKLKAHKNKVISKLTGGLAGMAKMRKITVLHGNGQFVGSHALTVTAEDGTVKTVGFKNAIIAAGSSVVHLPFAPKDDRIVDSTGALELRILPKKMLIIGGGIIGLEMGTVYSTLGARLDVVEMMDGLMQGADRDLVKVWQKMNAPRFDNVLTNTKTVAIEAKADGVYVTFAAANDQSTAPTEPQRYDLVLQAVGRKPNGGLVGADKAGVLVTDRGFIPVDKQMRTNVPHIFAIGDLVGQPMLAHKAVHEAHVAAEVCAGHKTYFDAKVIPSVAYTDPEVAWVGETEDALKAAGIAYKKGLFPWAASGRAIANGRDEGFTKLLFAADTGFIIGGGIVGTHAGDMIGEVALAIEMNATSVDIGKTIHPHPTLGESIGLAAEAADGHCTDLPPVKKSTNPVVL